MVRGKPMRPAADHDEATVTLRLNDRVARVRTIWWYGLGALWLVAALLQAQPIMFSSTGLAYNVLLPATAGQPGWIAAPMQWGIELWQAAPAFWNTGAVVLEAVIAPLLLMGPRRAQWGRAGLALSIGWGLIVWFFGEGLGGLFAGSATYLSGAPGSVALYVLLAAALLLPDTIWSSTRMLPMLRIGSGALWAILALLQLAPLFWSPLGLASVLQNVAMMPLPFGLSTLDAQLVASMAAAPVLWNLIICVVALGLAVVMISGRGGIAPYVLGVLWLLLVWVVFQGLGMVFSQMATDLNTPPVWALMLVPGWIAVQARQRPRTAI